MLRIRVRCRSVRSRVRTRIRTSRGPRGGVLVLEEDRRRRDRERWTGSVLKPESRHERDHLSRWKAVPMRTRVLCRRGGRGPVEFELNRRRLRVWSTRRDGRARQLEASEAAFRAARTTVGSLSSDPQRSSRATRPIKDSRVTLRKECAADPPKFSSGAAPESNQHKSRASFLLACRPLSPVCHAMHASSSRAITSSRTVPTRVSDVSSAPHVQTRIAWEEGSGSETR